MARRHNRDEFNKSTRTKLALRAGNICSFPECGKLTSGPSAESSTSASSSGHAAHIHAAAPGGRRYLAEMTQEERSHIENGIWLCATHAGIVDDDELTYKAEVLRKMKAQHEAIIKRCHSAGISIFGSAEGKRGNDLILFEFWKTGIDLKSLTWNMQTRPIYECDIIIEDDFIVRCIRFLDRIEETLLRHSPSWTIKKAMQQFIGVVQDLIDLIDESDPRTQQEKYYTRYLYEQAKGDFLYLVDTQRENPWGLSASDQIDFEKNVLWHVMKCMIITANGILHAANGVELFRTPHPYIVREQEVPDITSFPYPGLKAIRKRFLKHYSVP